MADVPAGLPACHPDGVRLAARTDRDRSSLSLTVHARPGAGCLFASTAAIQLIARSGVRVRVPFAPGTPAPSVWVHGGRDAHTGFAWINNCDQRFAGSVDVAVELAGGPLIYPGFPVPRGCNRDVDVAFLPAAGWS